MTQSRLAERRINRAARQDEAGVKTPELCRGYGIGDAMLKPKGEIWRADDI
jgi:hypothetical protein